MGAGGTATGEPGVTPSECLNEPTTQDCATCLMDEFPAGFQVYVEALWSYCVCGLECSSTCSTECGSNSWQEWDGPLTDDCDDCFDGAVGNDGLCGEGFDHMCSASTDCVYFVGNLKNCP